MRYSIELTRFEAIRTAVIRIQVPDHFMVPQLLGHAVRPSRFAPIPACHA